VTGEDTSTGAVISRDGAALVPASELPVQTRSPSRSQISRPSR
jgi:hypothetical protein